MNIQATYSDRPASKPVTVTYTAPARTMVIPEDGHTETREARTYTVSTGGPGYSAMTYMSSRVLTNKVPENDSDSFTKIRQSGDIKMSPYSHITEAVENFLIMTETRALLAIHPSQSTSGVSRSGVPYGYRWYDDGLRKLLATSQQGITVDEAIRYGRPLYGVAPWDDDEVAQAIREVKSQVVADTLQSYDLLTDLAELKETMSLAISVLKAVTNPLSAMSNFAQAVSRRNIPNRRKAQAITDKWMEYRYGIMPAVYSMQDIIKLVTQLDFVYRTCRAQRQITVSDSSESLTGPNEKCVYQTVKGTVKIRATSKTRFELGNLSRLIDQTSINFTQTAWELIPYSFVIDWFANVGDWLLAHTNLATPGVTSRYCYSIKKDITRETYVRTVAEELTSSVTPVYGSKETIIEPGYVMNQLGRIETWTNYDRVLFGQDDVDFYVSSPYMSWKRWVDSFSLSLNQLNKALRRLP